MPAFSKRSRDRLSTTHPNLQRLFTEVVKHFDCTILCGHRTKEEQNKAYAEGNSKLKWPRSKHNTKPSIAVDVIPYPIRWKDRERMHLFAGYVIGLAHSMGIGIRWGGDWDSDTEVNDNNFDDLVHFELVNRDG